MVQPERETTQRDYGLDADREIGQYGVGNIDLYARPKYQYDDGAIATVESMSFNEDGREILVPTIAFDQSGRAVKLTDDQAIRRYHDTGEYLGMFGTPEEATAYAERLHEAQDYYYNRRSEGGGSRTAQLLAKRGIAAGDLSAPANAGSKAALQTLRETGAVTYGGKAYTLPDQIAPEQAEALKRFQAYQALSGAADFEEKSRYQTTANGNEKFNSFAGIYTDTGFNDTLYDFINGNEAAQGHQMVNDTKSNTSHEHLKDLPEATVKTFNYLYATEGPEAAYEYIDFVTDKDYTGIETMALGVLDGTGLASISAAVGAALGTDASKERNREWYSQLKQDAAAAREQHPVMYGAGSVGGTLGLMAGVGGALGAAEGALASGVTIGGQTVALQMSPLVQGVVNGGLTFLAKDAVQNAGAAATGLMSGGDYLKAAGKSGVQGVAGGLAGGLVGSGMAEVLRRTGLMTPFMEFVRQSVTGFASAGANIGTGYALSEEKPSNEQIATDLATAFLFSVLQSGISTYNSTQAAKAQMDAALKEVQSGYSAMSQGWENMTPEARAAQAQNIITQTQSLRNSLNSRYIAGQQSMVNEMNQALDGIEASLQAYVNGFQTASAAAQAPGNLLGGAAAAGAAETKATEELRRQVQEAVEQGLVRAQGGAPKAEWTGPKADQTSVLPVLGAEAVRKTGQQETIEPERPALPSLAEPQQKQKPQGLPEPSPEPEALTLPKLEEAGNGQKETVPTAGTAGKPRMEMADFTNPESSVWNNVEYGDTETQSAITQTVHKEMVEAGEVVKIPDSTAQRTAEAYPDLRSMKKNERAPILRQKMNVLKASLRQFLDGLKGTGFEFEVNGSVLEARLYSTGIREVMEKINQDKASMLYHSDEIFRNAKYLYSTPDYDGDPNVYRWNYFYSPVQIGDEIVGVRIAVRDISEGLGGNPESQIYNWGIKKGPAVGGGRPPLSVASSGASLAGPSMRGAGDISLAGTTVGGGGREQGSDTTDALLVVPDTTIPQPGEEVNAEKDRKIQNGGLNDGEETGAPEDLSGGDRGRLSDPRAGGETGGPEKGSGRTGGTAEQSRAAAARQNRAKSLRREKISSRELGLESGTDTKSISSVPLDDWDDPMFSTAERIWDETGVETVYVLGSIEVAEGDGQTVRVRGVYEPEKRIVIQADNLRCTIDQIADHEIFHDKAFQTPGLVREIEDRIAERYGREEFNRVVDTYIQRLRGVVDLPEDASGEEIEAAYLAVLEEIYADAYAGINAFGANAGQYGEVVEEVLEDRGIGRRGRETGEATDRTTGPPRYSYGGRNARGTDSEALAEAERLEMQGLDPEEIRQETGWFRGMDGLWRFEIDDSGMEYSSWGDMNREDQAEYARFRELEKKFIVGSVTEEEQAELRRLIDEGHGPGRAEEQGTLKLSDFIRHDELFRNYPQLRKTGLMFRRLPEGVNGSYSPEHDVISLSEDLRNAPEDTLIHEIQHAIQRAEGFAKGSSPEYWKQRREDITETIRAARENLDLWLNDIGYNEYVKKSISEVVSKQKTIDRHWKDLQAFKDQSKYAKQIARCEEELKEYQQQYDSITHGMTPTEQYLNTAGEIEARDVSARRRYNKRVRRQLAPDLGDEKTVFAEDDAGEYGDGGKIRFSMDEPVEETKDLLAVHNLGEKDLEWALGMGGLPMPSIAVIKAEQGHSKYGPISIVFNKDTIDPQASRKNRVFGGDAWTQTAPSIEYPVNYEARRALEDRLAELAQNVADGMFSRSSVLASLGLDDVSGMDRAELAKKLSQQEAVKAAYLADQGKTLEPVMKEKPKQYDPFGNDALDLYIEKVGPQRLSQIYEALEAEKRFLDQAELQEVREALKDLWRTKKTFSRPLTEERLEMRAQKVDEYRGTKFVKSAWEYTQGSGEPEWEVDRYATRDAMNELADDETVQTWIEPQLEGILGTPGIRNTKDPFTPAGRSRSFDELHDPYTLEGIVKAMTARQDRGAGIMYVDAKAVSSVATPEYKSVDAIKADSERLQTVDQEAYDAALQELDQKIEDFKADVAGNMYSVQEAVGEALMEGATGTRTDAALKKVFVKYGLGLKPGQAKAAREIYQAAASLPTGYFEAKPERVVRPDEWAMAVVPDDLPADLRQKAEEAGLRITEYKAGDDEDRLRALNSNPGLRFSVDDSEQTEGPAAETGGKAERAPTKPEKKAKKPERKKPVAESKPIIAKRDLRKNLLGVFSIPEGQKAELGAVIDSFADRLLREGALTEQDREAFFDRLYSSGVMTMEADEYYQIGRSAVAGGKIFVNDIIRGDFGDDWSSFRRRAFAAGVYLTDNRSDTGVDVWNQDLSEVLPGMFNPDELDGRTILERIVQAAEEGKDEKMSLAEYAARIAQEEYVSEDELLENLERQMDWALRTFAEKANLEIKLRDRTGVKIAQEREKFAETSSRQREREALRRGKEREARREMMQRQRENRELRQLQQKTLKQLQWLNKNRFRAPEDLRDAWDEVLGDIDLYAVGAANEMNWSKKYGATWKDLAQMYQEAKKTDPNFLPSKDLERIVARLDGDKIADMDVSALQDLYKAAVGLRTEFYNRNNVINDEKGRMFAEVYTDSKREIEEAAGGYTGKGVDKFVNLEQLTPMNVLERMGGWNPNGTFYSMAKQLEQGERDARAYTVEAKRQIEDFLVEHEDWVKRADGQGEDAIWYELEVPELLQLGMGDKPIFGKTIKVYMTPAQKVHLYLESKSTDNLRHMTGGRTFVNKDLYSEGKRTEALAQGVTVRLAPETVKKIVSDLTEEEMELAKALERYYNDFAAKKINAVSNPLYGYDKAVSKNYAPIYTNQNYTKSEIGIYDATAEGVGHLKGRQYAVNPSYNISAFDAFERHIDQTSRFVGMAIPARNWQTFLNWREKNNSTGDVITHKWGEEGKRYIENLLTELQSGKIEEKSGAEQMMDTVLSNYISSVFGFNPSIVFKQAMSFPLAGTYLGWESLPNVAAALRTDDKLINAYTSELAYRLMGYATPETAQLKNNPSGLSENKFMNFTFGGGAITAMDGWTVKTIWRWAENAVRRDQAGLEMGSQEQIEAGQSPFYQEVARRFEEAVSRSQPMYDVMHRAQIMRNSSKIVRALTLFKTVPQQQYNMLRQTAAEASYYKKAYEEGKASKEEYTEAKKRAGRTVLGILLAGLGIEAINFLNAMLKNKGKRYRDEDGDLSWSAAGKQFLQGFASDNVGMMIGGDLTVEILGSVITGDAWYGIEAPGITQIQDILEQFIDTCGNVQKLVKEGYNVVKNGGDLGAYFRRRGADYLGAVEEALSTVATYFGGIAYNNIKSYTLGVLRWLSPKAQTSVEDMMETADKSGLAGLTGEALETRIADILKNRIGSSEEETAEALAALYEAGFKTAVPSDTPGSISVDSESRKLNAFQQQLYDSVWKDTVSGNLDELAASEAFRQADQETRAKMLKALYDYAGELAKAEVFDDYAISSAAEKAETLRTAGGSAADWASWTGASNGMKNEEKFRLLAEIGYSDQVKAGIVGTILGTALETEAGEPTQYAKMQSVLDSGLDIDEYLELKADGAVEEYLKGIERGASPEETARAARSVSEIKADAEDDSTKLELCREALKGTQDQDEQLAALSMLMTEGEYARLEVGVAHGITPEQYITAREAIARIDDNQSVSQDEATRAISSMLGLTNAERAVLWQLQNKSWKPKNNPFSASTGERVYQTLQSGEGGTLPRLGAAKGEELQGLSLPKLG